MSKQTAEETMPKKTAGHTPGPWKVTEETGKDNEVLYHAIRDRDGRYISSTWGGPHEANARLIAAAPELLEALREALKVSHDPKVEKILMDAIAKAEGR